MNLLSYNVLQIIFEFDMDNYRYWENNKNKYETIDNKCDGWKLLYKIDSGIYPKDIIIDCLYIKPNYTKDDEILNRLFEKIDEFNIIDLYLECYNIIPLTKFPKNLKSLDLNYVKGEIINLPENLKDLDIIYSDIVLPNILPKTLESIRITKMIIDQDGCLGLDLSNLEYLDNLYLGKYTKTYNLILPTKFNNINVGYCSIYAICVPKDSVELIKNIDYSEYIEYSDEKCKIET